MDQPVKQPKHRCAVCRFYRVHGSATTAGWVCRHCIEFQRGGAFKFQVIA